MYPLWQKVIPSPLDFWYTSFTLRTSMVGVGGSCICWAMQKGLYNPLATAPEAIILASCLFNKHCFLSLLLLWSRLLSGRIVCYFPNNSSLASQQDVGRVSSAQQHWRETGRYLPNLVEWQIVNTDFPVFTNVRDNNQIYTFLVESDNILFFTFSGYQDLTQELLLPKMVVLYFLPIFTALEFFIILLHWPSPN